MAREEVTRLQRDVQQEEPRVPIRLDRVGVTGLRRIIRLAGRGADGGSSPPDTLFDATLDLFVELPAGQKGAHMSRFSDTVEDALAEIGELESSAVESLAERIARQLTVDQRARQVEAQIRAHFPLTRRAPVSGKRSQELYTLIGMAVATRERCVRLVGVEVEGMMACPCAQEMVRAHARERLLDDGVDETTTDRVLDLVPLATHNQRGRGQLLVGTDQSVGAEDLVDIVEAAMSSQNYDLLKRPDELFVVEKAHRQPRFVEDAVREMLRSVVATYERFPDDAYVHAKQVNLETIHKHEVFAERGGVLGEIRAELRDGVARPTTTMTAWIAAKLAD